MVVKKKYLVVEKNFLSSLSIYLNIFFVSYSKGTLNIWIIYQVIETLTHILLYLFLGNNLI